MRKQSLVRLHAKPPRYTQEELELEEQRANEVEAALKLVIAAESQPPSPSRQKGGDSASSNITPLTKFQQSVKGIQKSQQDKYSIKSLLQDKRLSIAKKAMERKETQEKDLAQKLQQRQADNQREEEQYLEKFDCVLESEARILELFQSLAEEEAEDLELDDEEALMSKKCGVKDDHYKLKLQHQNIEDLMTSMGAMSFDADLVAKDNTVAKILEMKDDFIEEAFQSRINESRHIQLMYDKFRRYRKREEDKMEVRMQEVRRAGNVDSLEGKLQERAGQLSAVQREVAQKEKFHELIQNSSRNSSTDQIRAMLELSAQEEVEVLMKILEGQQGEILTKLMHQKTVVQDMTDIKKTLTEQYAALAESNVSNKKKLAQIEELKEDELNIRTQLSSAEAEKARLTAAQSKALKTILVTSLQNEGLQASLVRVQQESPELAEAKVLEGKVAAARETLKELQDKHAGMETEFKRLLEVDRELKVAEERAAAALEVKSKLGMLAEDYQQAGGGENGGEDYTAQFGEVIQKSLGVDRSVHVFMDKETALAEDAAAALRGHEEEGGDFEGLSIDDVALGNDNVNFAIKLGFKGKDKKAQEKMQLTQGLDAAQFARDHVTYQSYGLGAALEQIEGIFKLIYIDPDIMQTAEESSDDEDEDESEPGNSMVLKEDEGENVREREGGEEGSVKEIEGGGEGTSARVLHRLKRQETTELEMCSNFEKTFGKQPILNQRYEDIFRNKPVNKEKDKDHSGSSSSDLGESSVYSERSEFDPSRRREAEGCIAAPSGGQEGSGQVDLLRELGVDEWGKKVHTKEAQRKGLFLAHLQREIQDCTKVTDELTRRKVMNVSSKVDSNYSKENKEKEVVELDLQKQFPDVINESPSFELGVTVYSTCQQLAAAIVRRRETIAIVKQMITNIAEKTKQTLDIVADKVESRDYAYETFARNLKKLEGVQKKKFRYKSEVDIEKGKRLKERLQGELAVWRGKFKELVQGTEFERAIEEVEEEEGEVKKEVEEEEEFEEEVAWAGEVVVDEVRREVLEDARWEVLMEEQEEDEQREEEQAAKREQLQLQKQQEKQQLEEEEEEEEEEAMRRHETSNQQYEHEEERGRVEQKAQEETEVVDTTAAAQKQRPPLLLPLKEDLSGQKIGGKVAEENEEEEEEQDWVSVSVGPTGGVSEEGSLSLSLALSVRLPGLEELSSSTTSDPDRDRDNDSRYTGSIGAAGPSSFGLEEDSVKEAVRVLLCDALPMKVAPPPPSTDDEGVGSRANSSRMRRFRYSGELADVKTDAFDNTPVATPPQLPPNRRHTPLHQDEQQSAVVRLPPAGSRGGASGPRSASRSRTTSPGAIQWGSQPHDWEKDVQGTYQDHDEVGQEQRPPNSTEQPRLNSPRTGLGSGRYSPVPTVSVRQVTPLQSDHDSNTATTTALTSTAAAMNIAGNVNGTAATKAAVTTARPTVGRAVSLSSEDIELVVPRPLVTNYFVPKSLLKRTAKLASQVQRWKQVATNGGVFQDDSKGVTRAETDHSAHGADAKRIDAFWPEALRNIQVSPSKPSRDHAAGGVSNHFPHSLPPAPNQDDQTPALTQIQDQKPTRKQDDSHRMSDLLSDSLSTLNPPLSSPHTPLSSQHDPNAAVFPIPESLQIKRMSLSDVAFENTSLSKKEVAVEKAIITRKILRVSAWDRVVGMKTSFMKKYIQQELRDPRVVRVINSYNQMKRRDEYQDNFEYADEEEEDEEEEEQFVGERVGDERGGIGENGFVEEEGVQEKKSPKSLKQVLRQRVQQIIRSERSKQAEAEKNERLRLERGDDEEGEDMAQSIIRVSVDLLSAGQSVASATSGAGSGAADNNTSSAGSSMSKRPSSKYFLDERSEHDSSASTLAANVPTPSGTAKPKSSSKLKTETSLTDSIQSMGSISGSEVTRGEGGASNQPDVAAPPDLGDGYSLSLNSAMYDLFDQGGLFKEEEERKGGDVNAGGQQETEIERVETTGSSRQTNQLRTSSCGTDDGGAMLLVPPSPRCPNPSLSLKSNYGRSLIAIGAQEEQRFKLEGEKEVTALGSELATSTALPHFPGTIDREGGRELQPTPPAFFPYEPPSALKASNSLLSPRHKNYSKSAGGKKVLFTSDFIKKI